MNIEKLYTEMLAKRKVTRENMMYAGGRNVGILTQKDVSKPDNRIVIPLAESAITDIIGYAGRPGEIHSEYVTESGIDDEITKTLNEINKYNREGIENSELLAESLSVGEAWELWWLSDNLKLQRGLATPEYKVVSPLECMPIYDNSLKPRLVAFARFWSSTDDDGKVFEHCDVYDDTLLTSYTRNNSEWYQTDSAPHGFTQVPAIGFRTTRNNVPIFESQKKIIDAIDSIMSKTQNEVDRFNALVALFPGKVDKEFIEKLSEFAKPYIDDLEGFQKWPEYLQKNYTGVTDFYRMQTELLKARFHETIKVPDMSDKEFAGNASGVAIAYKLLGLEFLVAEIEVYFRLGIEKRFDLLKDVFAASSYGGIDWDKYSQKIEWKRNLPMNLLETIQAAAMVQALDLSNDAVRAMIPESIIPKEIDSDGSSLTT